jgi:CBS domain-containing protein
MRITGPGKRIRIYIGESDRWRGQPLYAALLDILKREGLAGATVTRGVAGFGAHSRIHTAAIETLSQDLPLIVEIVDQAEAANRALALVGPMIQEGLITVEDVTIARYTHRYLHPIPGDKLVREVMTPEVVTVTPETSIADVMDLLIGQQFKTVPVVDADRKVLGIIGDGALIARGGMLQHLSVGERLDAETLANQLAEMRRLSKKARDVMTAPVKTVSEDTPLAHAASIMKENNLQRLPVVDKADRLTGILSRVDVLRTVASSELAVQALVVPSGAAQTVGEVMAPDVPTMPLDADLADIVEKMTTAALRRVIVVDSDGRATGIINDGDLVARVEVGARPNLLQVLMRRGQVELPNVTAAELMTPSVLTGPASTPVAEAIQQMLAQKRKRFVVVDASQRPIGIVDRQMLLHAVVGDILA